MKSSIKTDEALLKTWFGQCRSFELICIWTFNPNFTSCLGEAARGSSGMYPREGSSLQHGERKTKSHSNPARTKRSSLGMETN